MPTGLTTRVIDHLRRAALPRDGAGLGDGELLGCFVERRDEAAIAALVTRHGPMVWGACRRLLNHHDAEDAFQATFLVLVRKAASIKPREMVGNWLYGVAHQTALQARRAAARRGMREKCRYLPGAKRAYAPGETARLVVRVRNAGKKDVKFVYAWGSFYEEPPVVTNDAGKPVPLPGVGFSGLVQFKEVTLAPGKEIDLCELNLALQPASEKDKARPWTLYETGKFQLQFTRIGGNIGTGEIKFDPILSKLVTGKLELEVKSEPPPAATEKK